ncbi:MAG: RNA polymerase sigma factor [Saprospiraceae bacterium]
MLLSLPNEMEFKDDEILALIRQNNTRERGYRLLIKKYQKRLYAHIRNLVQTHEDTDDVLQNTFLKIFKNLNGFEQKSSLFTWIYRIATNEAMNLLQTKTRNNHVVKDNIIPLFGNSKAEGYFDEQQAIVLFEKAILALPEKQKLVFHLRYYEALTYEQISHITETSVGALKASYHHAIKKLESFIKENNL